MTDPTAAPRAKVLRGTVQNAGIGLRNVLLWDFVLILFVRSMHANSANAVIITRIWINVTRCSDSSGIATTVPAATQELSTVVPSHTDIVGVQRHNNMNWTAELNCGREEALMIWYAAEPYTEMSELSLHASRQTSVGCKASPSTSEAMRVQVCFTSVTSWQKLVVVELTKIVQSEKTDKTIKNDKD